VICSNIIVLGYIYGGKDTIFFGYCKGFGGKSLFIGLQVKILHILKVDGGIPPVPPIIHFLSGPPERKPNQKKELENVLSSEAVTQILQITQ
jgi:hypothetical protein